MRYPVLAALVLALGGCSAKPRPVVGTWTRVFGPGEDLTIQYHADGTYEFWLRENNSNRSDTGTYKLDGNEVIETQDHPGESGGAYVQTVHWMSDNQIELQEEDAYGADSKGLYTRQAQGFQPSHGSAK